MVNIDYRVFRLEDRRDPDAVDFWDFLEREDAEGFNNRQLEGQGTIRELTDEEIIAAALEGYKQDLGEYGGRG